WQQIQSNERKTVGLVLAMGFLLCLLGYFVGGMFFDTDENRAERLQNVYEKILIPEKIRRDLHPEDYNKPQESVIASVLFPNPAGSLLGVIVALIIWGILSVISYYSGDKILLASSKAKQIEHSHHPVLFNVVEEMVIASGLSVIPKIYIIDEAAPNAFATGRNEEHASVAVTAGLLETLNRDELQGVIAHEIAHIKNKDVLFMTMLGTMLGAIVLISDFTTRVLFRSGSSRRTSSSSRDKGGAIIIFYLIAVILILIAPIIAQFIFYASSRTREYLADAYSAVFTRYPEGLASALEKISSSNFGFKSASKATAPMFIVNPLANLNATEENWQSTHPPTQKRITILRAISGAAGLEEYNAAFCQVSGKAVGVIPFDSIDEEYNHQEIRQATTTLDPLAMPLVRARQTNDALWRVNGYVFIDCDCETKLKIPNKYSGVQFACPHCGREHVV
ncbi:MAG: M48 family metallopeptidase, partial [Candidatus Caenarcaniphilales bacterium]|nr:M48 family metallopeptidase [Candidatus Caenarcaniphilales bacterium]